MDLLSATRQRFELNTDANFFLFFFSYSGTNIHSDNITCSCVGPEAGSDVKYRKLLSPAVGVRQKQRG